MSDAAMNVRLGAKTKEFNAKMMAASKRLKKFGKSVSGIGRSMSTMFTMPILLAGAASVKLSMEFQKSMTKIQTLVGKTGAEIEIMKAGIMEMSTKTAKAPNELAEGLYFLESAGLRGANAMETLEQVAKGSAAGLGEMEALSVVAAAAQNAYGKETLTASDALDKFGVMVRTGMFDAQELSNVLGKQLGLASNLGISFDEVGALISTYTSTTGDATAATNGLSAIMMTFAKLDTKPTANQAIALEQIGMSAGSVKEMMGEKGLMGTMTHLQSEFDKNGIAMGNFFTSSQALKGALGVLGTQSKTYADNLDAMGNSAEFVGDAFGVTAETDAFKMEQAMNNLQVAGTQLGDSLAPVVNKISEVVMNLTNSWTSLDKETQDNYASWAIWIATVGPALMLIGGIISKIGLFVGIMKKWQVLQKAAIAAQWLWNAALTANPIGVVVMAIAALVAAIVYFSTSTSTTAIKVRNAFTVMANVVIGAINYLIGGINRFSKHLGFTIPKIKKWKKEALPAVEEVGDAVADTSEEIKGLATNLNNLPTNTDVKVTITKEERAANMKKTAVIGVGDEEDPFEKSQRAFDIEKKSLANIAKLKKQFLVLNAKDDQEAARIVLQQQKQLALDKVVATGLGAEERLNIEKNFDKKYSDLLKKQKDANDKTADATATKWEQTFASMEEGWNAVSNVASQVTGAISAAADAKAKKEEVELENKHTLEEEEFALWQEGQDIKMEEITAREEAGLITKQQAAKQIEALQKTSEDKKTALQKAQDAESKKIEIKSAKREKKMAIMSAIMSGATAVLKALGSAPPPLNFVLAGIVAGLAGIQIAAVSSTPIPMADGGIAFGPTNALVGEYAGAKNNPEVVAPLDKLKGMLADKNGDSQKIEIFGRLDGNDIFLSNDNASNNRLRFT
tara:strand:- start:5913 stop:8636 length:2724 start_codon:yes stop_codon:yes gene_type:complete